MDQLVLLSGPPCVGKGSLIAALKRLYPELARKLNKLVLHTDRPPRPGEANGVHYHFVQPGKIPKYPKDKYLIEEIREGNWQAVEIADIWRLADEDGIGFAEVFHTFGPRISALLEQATGPRPVKLTTVFLSPLSEEEIRFLKGKGVDITDFVTRVMRRKLLRRAKSQNGILSAKVLKDVERRANSAYGEMRSAATYDYIIVNHDGEDTDNWERFYYPIGDARRTLSSFVDLLQGRNPANCARWSAKLLP